MLSAPKCNARVDNRIKEVKVLLSRALKDNKVFELETILDSVILTKHDTKESDKIYNDLRLHLIHSQICIAKHFRFKRDQREKRELKASLVLKKALEEEKYRK